MKVEKGLTPRCNGLSFRLVVPPAAVPDHSEGKLRLSFRLVGPPAAPDHAWGKLVRAANTRYARSTQAAAVKTL